MKKIFTFLFAMAFVFGAFAQTEAFHAISMDQPNANPAKSDWYGTLTSNTISTGFGEGTIIVRRFEAGELPVGGQIEKIHFYAYLSYNNQNYNTNFTVRVYTGGDGSWTADSSYTADPNPAGTIVAQQSYTATASGAQELTLNTPVTIPSGQEVWIGVECAGNSILAFQCDDSWTEGYSTTSIWYKYYPQDEAFFWASPRWCDDEECETTHRGEWELACYVNDGQSYQERSDFVVYMVDPFTSWDDATLIDEQVINEDYEYDSLYVCIAYFNEGVDEAQTNQMHLTAYIEGVEDGTFLDWDYSDPQVGISDTAHVRVGYGNVIGNIADDGIEGAVPFMSIYDLADYGLTYPFDVCANMTYPTDPDLSNNTACVTFKNGSTIGIQENANNTLSVYPNPAKNVITVSNAAGAQISIYNLAGQQVANVNAASANQVINVANLSEGLYVIRVANGNQVSTSKFSVVR